MQPRLVHRFEKCTLALHSRPAVVRVVVVSWNEDHLGAEGSVPSTWSRETAFGELAVSGTLGRQTVGVDVVAEEDDPGAIGEARRVGRERHEHRLRPVEPRVAGVADQEDPHVDEIVGGFWNGDIVDVRTHVRPGDRTAGEQRNRDEQPRATPSRRHHTRTRPGTAGLIFIASSCLRSL